MKLSTLFGIVLEVILIGLINGKVDFCLEFDSNDVSGSEGNLKEASILLKKVGQEIENVIRESGGAQTANYSNYPLNISHPAVTLTGNFTNGTTYTTDPTVRLWTPKNEGLEIFNLTFPYIFMDGSYNANGYVGANRLFDIYGDGNFSLSMNNFSVAAVTGLVINSSALCIPLTINVYLEKYQSYFVNFMNGDEELEPLLNKDLQSIVPDAIRIIFRESMDEADPYLQAIIDKFLHGIESKSLSKLLYILANNKNQLNSILENA